MKQQFCRQMLELGTDEIADGDQRRLGTVAFRTHPTYPNPHFEVLAKAAAQTVVEVFDIFTRMLRDRRPRLLERGKRTCVTQLTQRLKLVSAFAASPLAANSSHGNSLGSHARSVLVLLESEPKSHCAQAWKLERDHLQ